MQSAGAGARTALCILPCGRDGLLPCGGGGGGDCVLNGGAASEEAHSCCLRNNLIGDTLCVWLNSDTNTSL